MLIFDLLFLATFVYSHNYDENQAIRLFHLSAAAYGERIDNCVNKIHPTDQKWTLYFSSDQVCDILSHSCAYFITHSEIEQEAVIAFRGTTSKTQLFVEGWQSLTPAVDFFGMGDVNRYFITAHLGTWSGVEEYLKDPKYRNYRISFTGHSLGGALAALAAARTVKQGFRQSHQVRLYTYGEPRVGSLHFARSFDQIIPESYRIINGYDVVPHLPACTKNPEVTINNVSPCDTNNANGSYHHGTEVWYRYSMIPGRGSYKVCEGEPRNEDFACSDKLKYRLDDVGISVGEHREYFGVKVSSHGHSGCKQPITGVAVHEETSIDRAIAGVNNFFKRIGFIR